MLIMQEAVRKTRTKTTKILLLMLDPLAKYCFQTFIALSEEWKFSPKPAIFLKFGRRQRATSSLYPLGSSLSVGQILQKIALFMSNCAVNVKTEINRLHLSETVWADKIEVR